MKRVSSLISTITPILNGERFVDGLALNIAQQQCLPLQQIYSDNSSSDRTWARLQALKDQNKEILIHHEPKRLDAHGSWLAAASLARTEYMLLLPCDDRIHPLNILTADQLLRENPAIDAIGTPHVSSSRWSHIANPSWQNYLRRESNHLTSDKAFELALQHDFLPWPYSGLILRSSFFLSFLSTKESRQFEGTVDIALTLWLIAQDCNFAHRSDALTLVYRHDGQESSRLSSRWLSDYFKLVEYVLELDELNRCQRIQACTYFMKALPRHLLASLADASQDATSVALFFLEKYPQVFSRCCELDPAFPARLTSSNIKNEIGRRFLLSMGPKQMKLLAGLLRLLK